MVDFFDLLKTRRAVRNYQDKDVSLDLLMEIIQEACLAPSGGNRQTWRFILINNRDTHGTETTLTSTFGYSASNSFSNRYAWSSPGMSWQIHEPTHRLKGTFAALATPVPKRPETNKMTIAYKTATLIRIFSSFS